MAIKIPQNGRFSQPNNSDKSGNLWYTKNINLDEEGYIKLSSRSVLVQSEEGTTNKFLLPISLGRAVTTDSSDVTSLSEFRIVTTAEPYVVSLLPSDFSIAEDTETGNQTASVDGWGVYYRNAWHASSATKIYYTTGGTWTDTTASLTTGKVHALANFANKTYLAVSNGNTVLLLDGASSYTTVVTLTLPTDFEVIGLAYANNRLGIATMMSDTAAGQNQEAYFFIWNGEDTSAEAGYPVGSDTIMSIVAYKSSFVLLTRSGELKYFNGGGFDTLGTLPFYYLPTVWGDSQNRETYGDTMVVEGDVIYINIGNQLSNFGKNQENFLQNHNAGVLCFDPKVGIYHKYSPSLSQAYFISVLSGGVNTTTDVLTADSGTIPATGNPIKYVDSASSKIGGLTVGKVYFIIKDSTTTFRLAETREKALAEVKVDITSAAAGKFLAVNVLDYGTSKGNRSGGIGIIDRPTTIADHILYGSQIRDYDSTTEYRMLNMTADGFENRGYFTTPKISASGITGKNQKAFIKYRPLAEGDKIVVKAKDIDVLGIPVTTPQFTGAHSCTWSSDSSFYTSADLSSVESYINDKFGECEVEIISGAGAGSMVQILSITEESGTYSVELAESVHGAVGGYLCDIIIDNWKKLGEIDSTNTDGWDEFDVTGSSTWVKFKIELRGSGTTVEEFQFVSQEDKKAV